MATLSVILPVRNGMPHLERAVRSTLRAMPEDAELVVHDDCSDDDTARFLASVGDHRLRVITSTTPRGVAGGLNLLLDEVDSEFVGRMDADDISLPWRFFHQIRRLERGADVSFTTVVLIGDAVRPNVPVGISDRAFPLHLLIRNPVAHSTMCARLERVRAVGGYRSVPAEDYDLWMRLAVGGAAIERSGVPGLLYRVHAEQVTASADWKSASRSRPGYADAYAELSREALGAEPAWFEALRRLEPLEPGERARRLAELDAHLERVGANLGWRDRRLLRSARGALKLD